MAKNLYLAKIGRKGGKAKSEAKTAASRENAKKGGWPKGRKRPAKSEAKTAANRLNAKKKRPRRRKGIIPYVPVGTMLANDGTRWTMLAPKPNAKKKRPKARASRKKKTSDQ